MKLQKRLSNLLEECSNSFGYQIIANRGRIDGNDIIPLTLEFTSFKEAISFISLVFVSLRENYTSCDTVLFHELLKLVEVSIEREDSIVIKFTNVYLPND